MTAATAGGRWTVRAGTVHTLAGDNLSAGWLAVEDGYLAAMGPDEGHAPAPDLDFPQAHLIPGLIDIHVHGGGGWDLLTGGPTAFAGLGRYLASRGVTAYRPTLSTAALDLMLEATRALGETMAQRAAAAGSGGTATAAGNGSSGAATAAANGTGGTEDGPAYWGAQMLGIHLEGPFLNPEKKGAMPAAEMKPPSVELYDRFAAASGGHVDHLTIAPELPGALDLIRHAAAVGNTVSGGHTNATYEQFRSGVEAGIRLGTHTYNAMRGLHHREPGAFGAIATDERVWAELIADGLHVHPAAMRILLALKGVRRMCLISDAVATAGMPPGEYRSLGRHVVVDDAGFCRLPDGTLAGSTLNLLSGVANAVHFLGCTLDEALAMAARNPAEIAGCLDRKGTLEVGKDADFAVVDDDLQPLITVVGGQIVYDRRNERGDLLNASY